MNIDVRAKSLRTVLSKKKPKHRGLDLYLMLSSNSNKKCTWCVMHACFLLQESSKCCSPPIINVVVRTAFECASRHMLKHYGSCFAKLQVCLEKTILPVFLLNSKSCTVCFQWTRARGLYMPIHLKVRIACFMSCSFSMLCQMRRE
jgi:hypothetical protein